MLLLTYGFYKSNFIEMEKRVVFSHGEKIGNVERVRNCHDTSPRIRNVR